MKVLSLDYIRQNIQHSIEIKQQILQDQALLEAILTVAEVCVAALEKGNKLLLAGNGGSAGDAQHLAAELVGRFELDRPGVPAIALTTDSSMMTSISNDYGYEYVFARQLQAQASAGDVFIGISTSGGSKNIVRAMEAAKAANVTSVGLIGDSGIMQELSDYCLRVPANNTARIQESHIMLGHILCGCIESSLFPSK